MRSRTLYRSFRRNAARTQLHENRFIEDGTRLTWKQTWEHVQAHWGRWNEPSSRKKEMRPPND